MTTFQSDIILGDKYRDDQTGIEGVAISVHFYQYACERVDIEHVTKENAIKEYFFDAPRLTHIETGKKVKVEKTGGPNRSVPPERRA